MFIKILNLSDGLRVGWNLTSNYGETWRVMVMDKPNLTPYEITIETGIEGNPYFSVMGGSHSINIAIADKDNKILFAGFPHTILDLTNQLATANRALELACRTYQSHSCLSCRFRDRAILHSDKWCKRPKQFKSDPQPKPPQYENGNICIRWECCDSQLKTTINHYITQAQQEQADD
jgi:hypothetical protein